MRSFLMRKRRRQGGGGETIYDRGLDKAPNFSDNMDARFAAPFSMSFIISIPVELMGLPFTLASAGSGRAFQR